MDTTTEDYQCWMRRNWETLLAEAAKTNLPDERWHKIWEAVAEEFCAHGERTGERFTTILLKQLERATAPMRN